MSKKPPFKRPIAPRCLCRTWIHWFFQIVSPSLVFMISNDKTTKYYRKCREYDINVLKRKVKQRTASKDEYKRLKHLLKMKGR